MLKIFSKKALSLLPDKIDSSSKSSRKYETVQVGDQLKRVRVPHSTTSTSKVEPKVYLANERTLVSYINMGVLMSTLSLSLYNASNDATSKRFGLLYSAISIITIVYGYSIYQARLDMIKNKSNAHFDQLLGPLLISATLFFCICYNFYTKLLA